MSLTERGTRRLNNFISTNFIDYSNDINLGAHAINNNPKIDPIVAAKYESLNLTDSKLITDPLPLPDVIPKTIILAPLDYSLPEECSEVVPEIIEIGHQNDIIVKNTLAFYKLFPLWFLYKQNDDMPSFPLNIIYTIVSCLVDENPINTQGTWIEDLNNIISKYDEQQVILYLNGTIIDGKQIPLPFNINYVQLSVGSVPRPILKPKIKELAHNTVAYDMLDAPTHRYFQNFPFIQGFVIIDAIAYKLSPTLIRVNKETLMLIEQINLTDNIIDAGNLLRSVPIKQVLNILKQSNDIFILGVCMLRLLESYKTPTIKVDKYIIPAPNASIIREYLIENQSCLSPIKFTKFPIPEKYIKLGAELLTYLDGFYKNERTFNIMCSKYFIPECLYAYCQFNSPALQYFIRERYNMCYNIEPRQIETSLEPPNPEFVKFTRNFYYYGDEDESFGNVPCQQKLNRQLVNYFNDIPTIYEAQVQARMQALLYHIRTKIKKEITS